MKTKETKIARFDKKSKYHPSEQFYSTWERDTLLKKEKKIKWYYYCFTNVYRLTKRLYLDYYSLIIFQYKSFFLYQAIINKWITNSNQRSYIFFISGFSVVGIAHQHIFSLIQRLKIKKACMPWSTIFHCYYKKFRYFQTKGLKSRIRNYKIKPFFLQKVRQPLLSRSILKDPYLISILVFLYATFQTLFYTDNWGYSRAYLIWAKNFKISMYFSLETRRWTVFVFMVLNLTNDIFIKLDF